MTPQTGGAEMDQERLRQFTLFAGLSGRDLEWLLGQAQPRELAEGELLVEEGTPGGALYIIVEGTFDVTKRSGESEVLLSVCGPGEVIGELSVLSDTPRTASVRATRPGTVLEIGQETFRQLLASSPSAAMDVIRTVAARLQNTESMLRQQEKMAALGTLAAGLAHELNNPAAAARRSAVQLAEAVAGWEAASRRLAGLGLEAAAAARLDEVREGLLERARQPARLDALVRSDLESELQDWLEGLGLEEAWELAPTLVEFGWDQASLETLAQDLAPAQRPTALQWLAAGCAVYGLLNEVWHGSERISEIVRSVKSYAYLDQAPIQEVDVHEGLENTVVILRSKLKEGVEVERDYARDLPPIEAYASELNQVWTNLIDNAIDAMDGRGVLGLRTYGRDGQVVVEVSDTGPGIAPEAQERIFEPFYTTKPPGQGTGLGLHITYNIVVHKHQGRIEVDSEPGRTVFRVRLPVQLERR